MRISAKLGSLMFALIAVVAGHGCGQANLTNNPPAAPPPVTNAPSARALFEAQLPKQAQPKLPTIKVWVGAEELITEVALTGSQVAAGMMWRTNMAENEAMIFVHSDEGRRGYWMKNCFVPLSIAYIETDGTISSIHDMHPHDTNSVFSASYSVRFALETTQGWFDRHNIKTGAMVRTERGSLMETFFRRR
jgi:uncharacterized membrane protein (UPF0127 family)